MLTLTFPSGFLDENMYLCWDEKTRKAFVIDPGGATGDVDKACRREDLFLEGILLTHGHFDHIMGIGDLIAQRSLPVYIHEFETGWLSDPLLSALEIGFAPDYRTPPDIRPLRHGGALSAGGLTLSVFHTPGHSPGSVCYVADDAIFTGDTIFYENIGRTDLTGGSPRIMQETLRRFAHISGNPVLYPGHGEKTTLLHEKKHNFWFAQATR